MNFPTLPQHLAGIALHDSGDNFHERGFARAIFAEQQMDFAGLDGQVSVTQRCDAAVPFFDVVELEEHRKRTVYNGFGSLLGVVAAEGRPVNAPQAKPGRPPAIKKVPIDPLHSRASRRHARLKLWQTGLRGAIFSAPRFSVLGKSVLAP